jgi:hypothetical protein
MVIEGAPTEAEYMRLEPGFQANKTVRIEDAPGANICRDRNECGGVYQNCGAQRISPLLWDSSSDLLIVCRNLGVGKFAMIFCRSDNRELMNRSAHVLWEAGDVAKQVPLFRYSVYALHDFGHLCSMNTGAKDYKIFQNDLTRPSCTVHLPVSSADKPLKSTRAAFVLTHHQLPFTWSAGKTSQARHKPTHEAPVTAAHADTWVDPDGIVYSVLIGVVK